MEAVYRWTEYFTKQRLSCRCEVINRTSTRATIKLKEYGPLGKPPGTMMNVKLESVGIKRDTTSQVEPNWHDWTD